MFFLTCDSLLGIMLVSEQLLISLSAYTRQLKSMQVIVIAGSTRVPRVATSQRAVVLDKLTRVR